MAAAAAGAARAKDSKAADGASADLAGVVKQQALASKFGKRWGKLARQSISEPRDGASADLADLLDTASFDSL